MIGFKAVLFSFLSMYGLAPRDAARRRRPPVQIGRPYPGR